jgi:amino acid adenylation domain-containing protein
MVSLTGIAVDALPASFAQARLWFLDRLNPGSPAYVSDVPLRVRGALDPECLEDALNVVVDRHEALRTRFVAVEGEPVQVVEPSLQVTLEQVDLRGEPDPLAAAQALAEEIARTPFDLARGPLVRAVAAQLGGDDWAVLLAFHHVVVDGWSLGILFGELREAYAARLENRPPRLPHLPLQYGDYAIWQREHLRGSRLDAQLAWWRGRLRDPPTLNLPTDRPRPPLQSHRGGRHLIRIGSETAEALRELAARENASLFMCLLACYGALLRRWSGQTDILVGTPFAGRPRRELERLVGFFVNMLALRLPLDGDPTFRELLRRVRHVALDSFGHAEIPFERLVSDLARERDLSRNPLFQTTFALQPPSGGAFALPGLDVSHLPTPHETVKFELALTCAEAEGGILARFAYANDLFDPPTIARLAGHFSVLVEAIARDPDTSLSRLPILTAREQADLARWNTTAVALPEVTVPEAVASQAARTPQVAAVEHAGTVVTYAELLARADALAAHLAALGAGPERVVAVLLDPGPELVASEFGVMRAGAAFLPLDASTPPARVAGALAAVEPIALVSTEALAARLPGDVPPLVLMDRPLPDKRASPKAAAPGDLAYLIATSGTSGAPKVVAVEHRSLLNHLLWVNDEVLADVDVSLPAVSSPAFDASLKQLLGPLLRGGTVWIPTPEERLDPAALLAALAARRRVTLNCVPALWEAMLELAELGAAPVGDSLECLLLGGERLPDALAARTFALLPDVVIWNLYGPTEATVNALATRVEAGETVTIGRALPNVTAHVLDEDGAEQPVGVPGELYLGGLALARGYYQDADATSAAFGPHVHEPGRRLYRTGDQVVREADGRLRFVGRLDDQVKVRGIRIELDEIAASLRSHPAVRDAVVLLRDGALAAYLVPHEGMVAPPHELRAHLAAVLPNGVLPATFTTLTALPRTPHGKLDRDALPAPVAPEAARLAPPRTETEEKVAELWRALLGRDAVGRDDNFFDLGGHSLLLVRAHARLVPLAPRLTIVDLFGNPTVRTVAACIDARASARVGERVAG